MEAVDYIFMLMPLEIKKRKEDKWSLFFRRYRWCLIIIATFLLIFFLLAPYLFRTWTKYPQALRAEIAWRNFYQTFQGSCREDCLAKRQSYANIWRPYYQAQPVVAAKNFEIAFATDLPELQAALIKIMAADANSAALPLVLERIIADPQASAENKRLIVTYFPEAFQNEAWLAQVRAQSLDLTLSERERAYALKLLIPFPNRENAALVKSFILKSSPDLLLETAFQVLAAWDESEISWSEADVNILQNLILVAAKGPARWRRLWLLADIASTQKEVVKSALIALGENQSLDTISRSLIAETLGSIFNFNLITPTPTATDWQEFYEVL